MDPKTVPLNIITGFLGVGKTTAILDLLKNKPVGERWTVIINEFGRVAIDNSVIESYKLGDVEIKEVAGGCICCSASSTFQAALAVALFKTNPNRIIIEPSGLGFLSALDEALQSEKFRSHIDIRASICLVDANQLNDFRILHNEIYKQQLLASDVVLINKQDITPPEAIDRFKWWMTENIGPKQYIGQTLQGHIDCDLLQLESTETATESGKPFIHFLKDKTLTVDRRPLTQSEVPLPGKPLIIKNQVDDYKALGLIFSNEDVFDKFGLSDVLRNIKALRLKGIFQTNHGNFLYNRINDYFSILPVSSTLESKMEMIVFQEDNIDVESVLKNILTCIVI